MTTPRRHAPDRRWERGQQGGTRKHVFSPAQLLLGLALLALAPLHVAAAWERVSVPPRVLLPLLPAALLLAGCVAVLTRLVRLAARRRRGR